MDNSENPLLDLTRAVITGILCALFVGVVGYALKWTTPWVYASLAGSGSALWYWLRANTDQGDNVVTLVNDGESTESRPQSVIIVEDGNNYKRLPDLWSFTDVDTFGQIADRCYNSGLSFSLSNFCGPSGILSRGQLENLRSLLLQRGFLQWRIPGAPSQGVQWTRPGLSLIRHYSELHNTPTLLDREGNNDVTFSRPDAYHTRATRAALTSE